MQEGMVGHSCGNEAEESLKCQGGMASGECEDLYDICSSVQPAPLASGGLAHAHEIWEAAQCPRLGKAHPWLNVLLSLCRHSYNF